MNESDFKNFPEKDELGRVLVAIREEVEQEVDDSENIISEKIIKKPIYEFREESYIKTTSPMIIKTIQG
jgi:hypothetical protein